LVLIAADFGFVALSAFISLFIFFGKAVFYGFPATVETPAHTSGTRGMKLSHIHHYFCAKII
jgi:hypothetical protein